MYARLLAAIVVLACLGAGALLFRAHESVAAVPLSAGPVEQEAYWKERIADVGGKRAYEEFAAAVAALPLSKQHEDAHAFGGALFEVEGKRGLSVCDTRFSYGCYHEFLGRAIATLGLGSVNELNQGCVDTLGGNALSCQHGIGHGVQAALGYDEAALKKALSICEQLPYNDPIGGCYGGLFMEYNMQTMLGDQAQTRPLKTDDPQYPCDTLEEKFQTACYFWSPQWWLNLQHQEHGPNFRDFAAIGALCDQAGSSGLVRSCYEGLGTFAPPESDYDAPRAAQLCEEASDNPQRQLYCLSYAANSFGVAGGGTVEDGEAVCDGLDGPQHEYCIHYARNEANIAQQLPALVNE